MGRQHDVKRGLDCASALTNMRKRDQWYRLNSVACCTIEAGIKTSMVISCFALVCIALFDFILSLSS